MSEKHDRRSLRTRQMLSEALVQLIQEKDYSAITVSDIIERANVGRSTFYAHYQGKDDLLLDQMDRVIEFLSQGAPAQEFPYFPSLGFLQHVGGDHYELYKALVWGPGMDLITRHLQKSVSQRVEQGLQNSSRDFDVPLPILANFITGSFLTLLKWWLENKRIHSPEQMDEIFRKMTLPGVR
ncbi:MAG: TetR/AcrR family transcriptional regulator [Bacteroidota bacterium]|jgi:AcrR family transcriptional regulator